MLNIHIAGTHGKMAKALKEAASHDPSLLIADDYEVLIDFTAPIATLHNLECCLKQHKKIVIGTTGFSDEQLNIIHQAAKHIPVLFAPNTSIGVNITYQLLQQAAKLLGAHADIHITETHHIHKKDTPSGTALQMAKEMNQVLGTDNINISSIREAEVVGKHEVEFTLGDEVLTITHQANSRAIFAQGALRAAKWLSRQKPGYYTMYDVLGSSSFSHCSVTP